MKQTSSLLLMLLFCLCPLVQAQDTEDQPLTEEETAALLADSIHGEKGVVGQIDCHFSIHVPKGYQLLDKAQSNHLLTDYWNNPQDDEVLGVLITDTAAIFADVSTAYVIYYDNSGYVSDKDAADINYDELLKDLQTSTSEANEARAKEGYPTIELVDWAAAPRYDNRKKTLCWAKHLRFNNEYDVLNYDIRVLGKEGFVIIQAVADLEECQQIIAHQDAIISSIQFDKNYTYADFNPKTDRIAEWTIGSLIAGKILAKAGLLAKLSVFLLKFWKLILIGVMAVAAPLLKRFKKKKQETANTEPPTTEQ